jgi:hypothetical protein
MTYTETRSDEDLAAVEVERWEPVASSSRPQHNFVPAVIDRPTLPPAILTAAPSTTSGAWTPHEALHEATDARDRAAGFVLRMTPLAIVWFVLSLAVAIVVWSLAGGMWAAVGGLMLWGSLTAGTWLAHDRQERMFAAGGIERHRLDLAHDLERQKLQQDHETRQAVIGAYLKRLEG